jgi:hypothetical protein
MHEVAGSMAPGSAASAMGIVCWWRSRWWTPNGGRKHENMTLAEEKALLARFAKMAGAGEMLNIHDLKAAYENRCTQPATAQSTVSCIGTAGAS